MLYITRNDIGIFITMSKSYIIKDSVINIWQSKVRRRDRLIYSVF